MQLNEYREAILLKGYATNKDIQRIVPCSWKKAKAIYDKIVSDIGTLDKSVSPNGIPVKLLMKHLRLSEKTIHENAALERQIKKDATTVESSASQEV